MDLLVGVAPPFASIGIAQNSNEKKKKREKEEKRVKSERFGVGLEK